MSDNAHAVYLGPELNSFDRDRRARALAQYADAAGAPKSLDRMPNAQIANMHCHSFFSYSALGLSPSALAVLAREEAIDLLGIVDFDVIDGVDEFLDACQVLGVRGGASMETRLYVPEFATREINSPGEPGVLYHMGAGFVSSRVPDAVAPLMLDLKQRARQRNEALVARVNLFLAPIAVDYVTDVLPLTPSENATERHIVTAYIAAVEAQTDDPAAFWSERLNVDRAEIESAMAASFGLPNLLRKLLMKRGGAAYVQPGPETFPKVEEFHELVVGCGGLPCATWLDGTSAGEAAMPELLDLLIAKGAVMFNIIPDRNWNLSDPAVKQTKLQNLYAVVELATARGLPILVGTELNSPGQPLVDQFDAPELAPVRDAFIAGAHFLYGHTMLARYAELGYSSAWAAEQLPDRLARNEFYTEIGRRLPPGPTGVATVHTLTLAMSPAAILAAV